MAKNKPMKKQNKKIAQLNSKQKQLLKKPLKEVTYRMG
jgi:hypothetical protein